MFISGLAKAPLNTSPLSSGGAFGGPGGGFGGLGGGFLGSSKSSGEETIKMKATTRATKTSPGLATLPVTTIVLNAE